MSNTLGQHVLLELYNIPLVSLNDFTYIRQVLKAAVKVSGATFISEKWRKFSPSGLTGILLLGESHLSIHTWPEFGYASLDMYTCGDKAFPTKAAQYIIDAFRPEQYYTINISRGLIDQKRMIISSEGTSLEAPRTIGN